ncbi:hypothetical protein AB0M28_33590 [Streptomyces sp. NPDC051940]|uniref:hypothetical protein n=1 Tax=Streptomyces sp. NPDC051940 TaxID=3155675 RepID=UPI00343B1D5A
MRSQVRVRMLLEAVDDPAETERAVELLRARGWTAWRAEAADSPPPARPRRTALIADLRLNGARRRALRAAADEVERLARRHELGLWVRDVSFVEWERPPRVTYHAHRKATRAGDGLLARAEAWWIRLGGADLGRALHVAPGTSREDVGRELAGRTLAGPAFEEDGHAVRVPSYSDEDPPPRGTPEERRAYLVSAAGAGAGALLAILCGMAVGWTWGWWALLPAVLGFAGVHPVGRWAKEARDKPLRVQLATGALVVALFEGFGAFVVRLSDREPAFWLAVVLLMGIAGFSLAGVWMALRGTFVVRHAVWILPLLVPVAFSMITWLGELMHTAYLDELGIPVGAVPSAGVGRLLVALEPLGLALGAALFFTAIAGWLRHFHFTKGENRFFAVAVTALLVVAYVLAAIGIGLDQAADAAHGAERAAGHHRDPAWYFGLDGHLVCAAPVGTDPIAIDNGPLPTDHPVLTYGAGGDWIWLWDPERWDPEREDARAALAVRREDVVLEPAPDGAGHCPP